MNTLPVLEPLRQRLQARLQKKSKRSSPAETESWDPTARFRNRPEFVELVETIAEARGYDISFVEEVLADVFPDNATAAEVLLARPSEDVVGFIDEIGESPVELRSLIQAVADALALHELQG